MGDVRPDKVQCLWRPAALHNQWPGKPKGIMPTLKQALADKKAQEPALRRNPEIDAKLDRFIGENPKLIEYYNGLGKEELIRKLMLGKMQRSEYANDRNREIKTWVEENPAIKAKIEERLRNVPAANRERAFINIAKSEAMNQTVKSPRMSVSG